MSNSCQKSISAGIKWIKNIINQKLWCEQRDEPLITSTEQLITKLSTFVFSHSMCSFFRSAFCKTLKTIHWFDAIKQQMTGRIDSRRLDYINGEKKCHLFFVNTSIKSLLLCSTNVILTNIKCILTTLATKQFDALKHNTIQHNIAHKRQVLLSTRSLRQSITFFANNIT